MSTQGVFDAAEKSERRSEHKSNMQHATYSTAATATTDKQSGMRWSIILWTHDNAAPTKAMLSGWLKISKCRKKYMHDTIKTIKRRGIWGKQKWIERWLKGG